jgi:CO/xanthine dehydrogenase Mo-binding subunit
MGYGLTEEVILDKGMTMTPSFSEYLLPTSMDVPDMKTILIESGDGVGPFGAKGVGEPSVCSVAPAVANAIYDAIGVRIYDLPLTPEKIVRAIKEKDKQ